MNIIHAGGIIDNHGYSNSFESVMHNIRTNKNRVFEVDVVKILDAYVIAHDYVEKEFYNHATNWKQTTFLEYKKLKVFGKYTPMDFYVLKTIIKYNPNFRFILDIKDNGEDYLKCLKYIKTIFCDSELSSLMPQIYEHSDLQYCIDTGFKQCHLALWKREYRSPSNDFYNPLTVGFIDDIAQIAKQNGITIYGISVWYKHSLDPRFLNYIEKFPYKVYLHGQADIDEQIYKSMNDKGVGFFRGFEAKE